MSDLTWFYVSFGGATGLAVGAPLAWLWLRGLFVAQDKAMVDLRRTALEMQRETREERKIEKAEERALARETRLFELETQRQIALAEANSRRRAFTLTCERYDSSYVRLRLESQGYVAECTAREYEACEVSEDLTTRFYDWCTRQETASQEEERAHE